MLCAVCTSVSLHDAAPLLSTKLLPVCFLARALVLRGSGCAVAAGLYIRVSARDAATLLPTSTCPAPNCLPTCCPEGAVVLRGGGEVVVAVLGLHMCPCLFAMLLPPAATLSCPHSVCHHLRTLRPLRYSSPPLLLPSPQHAPTPMSVTGWRRGSSVASPQHAPTLTPLTTACPHSYSPHHSTPPLLFPSSSQHAPTLASLTVWRRRSSTASPW